MSPPAGIPGDYAGRATPRRSRLATSRALCLMALACVCLLLQAGCGKKSVGPDADASLATAKGNAIVRTARGQIGARYKSGGDSPATGFDCSGFVTWVYARNGVSIPRVTRQQAASGRAVSQKQLRPGDVVVFKISRSQGLHTGIYAGSGTFIHSPSSGQNVREESIAGAYWQKRFVQGRRLL